MVSLRDKSLHVGHTDGFEEERIIVEVILHEEDIALSLPSGALDIDVASLC